MHKEKGLLLNIIASIHPDPSQPHRESGPYTLDLGASKTLNLNHVLPTRDPTRDLFDVVLQS